MKERNEFLGEEMPMVAGDVPMEWGSDAVAELLRGLGMEFVALNPGASFRGLHDSIVNYLGNQGPQILLTLHEESAVSIAQGYAKVKERPMGVIVHSNVGLMHATTPIFNAWCDRIPVVVLGATGPVNAAIRRPWIDWIHTAKDQGALIRQYIKWDDQPASVSAAMESLLRASLISQTPPRGPVYVCFDMAMLEEKIADNITIPDVRRFMPASRSQPSPQTLKEAATWLCRAEKPLILMGRTSRREDAWENRIQLAEALGARVLTDLKVGASFPSKHPLHAVPPGEFLSQEACEVIRDADVILSLDWIDLAGTLNKAWKNETVEARIIHCSVDCYNHNGWSMDYYGLPPTDLSILAEPDVVILPLLEAIKAQGGTRLHGERFRGDSNEKMGRGRPVDALPENKSGAISLRDLGFCIREALGDRETCFIQLPIGWPGEVLDFQHPLNFLGNNGGGGLGAGPGIAVGAALALWGSHRFPVAILGDGDFLMGDNALWTAARYRIPLLIVVANNRSYGNSARHQERVARQRGRSEENKWIGTRIGDPPADIAGIGRARGLQADGPITDMAGLPGALRSAIEAVESGQGYVLDVVLTSE